jgi:superoxide dismutase, Fe-Mn family
LQQRVATAFGSEDNLKHAFLQMAVAHFGSGWVWLVQQSDGRLDLISTTNANTPITENYRPLLVMDVWEHAYYVDYRNARAEYAKLFLEKLVNWKFAETQLS